MSARPATQRPPQPVAEAASPMQPLTVAALTEALRSAFPQDAPNAADAPREAMTPRPEPSARIAVVLPCYNESATIAGVVAAFRKAIPDARIFVFDNNSTDATARIAREAGAQVIAERRPGKGHVVRRMFAEIDADVYVMADGDGTYDAACAPQLVSMILDDRLDMAIGVRAGVGQNAHRAGHAFGNRAFNALYQALFGAGYGDIFSGYRAFSRRFVKSFPALSSGFEIETELSVHVGQLQLPVGEIETPYGARVEGSASKLRSVRDGLRILRMFATLLKETRPLLFFGAFAGVFAIASLALGAPLVETWARTGLVPRLPTAVLCTGLALIACLLTACGLILDSLARARIEQKRMFYLAVGSPRL